MKTWIVLSATDPKELLLNSLNKFGSKVTRTVNLDAHPDAITFRISNFAEEWLKKAMKAASWIPQNERSFPDKDGHYYITPKPPTGDLATLYPRDGKWFLEFTS